MNTQNKSAEIIMLVTFHVKPEYREDFKTVLIADARGAKTESGNVTMEVYESKSFKNVFYLFERWSDQSSLDEHFTKPYTLAVLEMNANALTSPMEIDYLDDVAPMFDREHKTSPDALNAIDLIITFPVKAGEQAKFLKQVQNSIKLSRPEEGNIAYHVHAVKGDDTRFVLYERWKDQAALDYHFQMPYTIDLFDVFKETLSKPLEELLNFVTEIPVE